tara:strand:- start:45 stop:254 length:210 start_codon:yes stop_codon:yes gene_type:complete
MDNNSDSSDLESYDVYEINDMIDDTRGYLKHFDRYDDDNGLLEKISKDDNIDVMVLIDDFKETLCKEPV